MAGERTNTPLPPKIFKWTQRGMGKGGSASGMRGGELRVEMWEQEREREEEFRASESKE